MLVRLMRVLACSGLAVMPTASSSPEEAQCKYYAYILYGEATLTADVRKSEKVYKATQVFKSEDGYRVCCNLYCSDVCATFSVPLIGPYDTEVVAYMELQRQISNIAGKGYKPYEQFKHMMIGLMEYGYKRC